MRGALFFIVAALVLVLISRIPVVSDFERYAAFRIVESTGFLRDAGDRAVNFLAPLFRIKSLAEENQFLKLENRKLLFLLSQTGGARKEKQDFIEADVVSRDPNLPGVLVIDKGLQFNIDDGRMAVDEYFFVVGITVQSAGGFSKVKTLLSEGLTFNVANSERMLVGTAKSEGVSGISVTFVDPSANISEGDYLFTAGQDRIFPAGFLVGRVITKTKAGSFYTLVAEPFAAIDKLSRLYILKQK